jgi:hypothetical protein
MHERLVPKDAPETVRGARTTAAVPAAEKRAQWVYYRLVPGAFGQVLDGARGCSEGSVG